MPLEEEIRKYIKQLDEERRLGDKRAEQFYNLFKNLRTSRARAYLSADQNDIADSTWTQIQLNAETFDKGGNFDPSSTNWKYVTPYAGCYIVLGGIRWKNVATGNYFLGGVYVDGSKVTQDMRYASGTSVDNLIADEFVAAAGKDVELWCYQNSGVSTPDIGGGEQLTYMAIHLLCEDL